MFPLFGMTNQISTYLGKNTCQVHAHLDVFPCLRTHTATMHVYANDFPSPSVLDFRPVQEVQSRLLALNAVKTHVPLQLDGDFQLSFDHGQLVVQRNSERG